MTRANNAALSKERLLKTVVSDREVSMLKALATAGDADGVGTDITELAALSGVLDSDEVLRSLYTLEGKRLAEPHPAGDLTSSRWKATDLGLQTLTFFGV